VGWLRRGRYVLLCMAVALLAALAAPDRAAAQPQPTLVLSPASGPCDATVEVTGEGFPLPRGPLESSALYLVQPGTADVSMEILNPAFVDQDGTFRQWAPLWKRGCEAATLDNQAEQPNGRLLIAATSSFEGPGVSPGERIPNIIAVARYTYTTTTPHVPTEALTISPSSGPCDGAVQVMGSGFEPGLDVLLKLGKPGSDDTLGTLASVTADANGGFVVAFSLGELGCRAAELNATVGDPAHPQIGIGAFHATYPIPPQGIPPVLASVSYTYTTTPAPPGGAAAQQQPTLTLIPGSGPCDATVQVQGSGFPVPSGPFPYVALYLLQPGSADVNASSLSSVHIERDGSFSGWAGLRQHGGCEAAVLDSQEERPTGHLRIAATLSQAPLQPGERIPDIIAVAQYTYTTTTPHVSTEALSISPASGPCDATVKVIGSGFEPAAALVLKLASASGEFGLGPLASAVANDAGEFEVDFSLGGPGCSTAELIAQYSSGGELVVGAFPATYPTPTPPGPPDPLAVVRYTFTTTTAAPRPVPATLPAAGTGPDGGSAPLPWLPLVGGVAALGLILMAASLYARRSSK
jgi:hypothetical protein